jgi:hypothetical protein
MAGMFWFLIITIFNMVVLFFILFFLAIVSPLFQNEVIPISLYVRFCEIYRFTPLPGSVAALLWRSHAIDRRKSWHRMPLKGGVSQRRPC